MTKTISLSHGMTALVDDEDYERVMQYRWYLHYAGAGLRYAAADTGRGRGAERKRVKLHRFILNLTDPEIKVDHIDGNGLNCQRANMRICTQAQNVLNTRKRKDNTSGYKGVSRKRKKWKAAIQVNGENVYLGPFPTPEEAARAYDRAARELHGRFANLNFPDEV